MSIIFVYCHSDIIPWCNGSLDKQAEKETNHDHSIFGYRYLTGFTLFLSLILNRTFFMILDLLKSEEKMEVIKKQVCWDPLYLYDKCYTAIQVFF